MENDSVQATDFIVSSQPDKEKTGYSEKQEYRIFRLTRRIVE